MYANTHSHTHSHTHTNTHTHTHTHLHLHLHLHLHIHLHYIVDTRRGIGVAVFILTRNYIINKYSTPCNYLINTCSTQNTPPCRMLSRSCRKAPVEGIPADLGYGVPFGAMKSLFTWALLHPNIHICHKPSTITPLFWLKHADMRANTPDMSGHWTRREGHRD
jgi:hypothetical protein